MIAVITPVSFKVNACANPPGLMTGVSQNEANRITVANEYDSIGPKMTSRMKIR